MSSDSNCTAWASVIVQQYQDCHQGLTLLGIVLVSLGSLVVAVLVLVLTVLLPLCLCRRARQRMKRNLERGSHFGLQLSQAELVGLSLSNKEGNDAAEVFEALHAAEGGSDVLRQTVRAVRTNSGKRKSKWYDIVYRTTEAGKLGFSAWRVHLGDTLVFTSVAHQIKLKNKDNVRLRVVIGTYDPVQNTRLRITFLPQEVTLRPGEVVDIEMDAMPVEAEDARLLLRFSVFECIGGTPLKPYYLPFRCRGLPLTNGEQVEFRWEQLDGGRIVGRGVAGNVYRVQLADQRVVAVKKFHTCRLDEGELTDFVTEAKCMARLRHPCIVRLLGFCADIRSAEGPRMALVLEYVQYGSLGNLLHPLLPGEQQIELPWQMRVKFALDAARAMAFMHRMGILHRDLKADNLLVASMSLDDSVNVKVADFSIGKDLHDTRHKRDSLVSPGTDPFKALEVLRGQIATRESDVWSFGVVLWEIAARQLPYSDLKSFQIHDAVLQGRRPAPLALASAGPPGYEYNMMHCWQDEPARRPSFDTMAARLRDIQVANGWRVCDTRDVTFEDPEESTADEDLDVDQVF